MWEQYATQLFAFEEGLTHHLATASGPIEERRSAYLQRHQPPMPPEAEPPGAQFPQAALGTVFDAYYYRVINTIGGQSQGARAIPITTAMIEEAKDFTSQLLGVDLGEVPVILVPWAEWDRSAEAFMQPAGSQPPHIFAPEAFNAPVELLCHELAHAAHTLTGHRSGDPMKVLRPTVSAEFVAHSVQYRYLLERQGVTAFAYALGQMTTAMYALAIYSYCLECGDPGLQRLGASLEGFLDSPQATPFHEALPVDVLTRQHHVFAKDPANLISELQRAAGIVMALELGTNPEGLREYIRLDTLSTPIADTVQAAFGQDLELVFKDAEGAFDRLLCQFYIKRRNRMFFQKRRSAGHA